MFCNDLKLNLICQLLPLIYAQDGKRSGVVGLLPGRIQTDQRETQIRMAEMFGNR